MNFNDIVQFPVPYLNHYVRYNRNESNSKYNLRLLKDNIPVQKNMVPVKTIKCPYPHCRAEYVYWNIRKMNREESMYCPACRLTFRPFIDINLRKPVSSGHMPNNVV
jgi:hypothetical protein